MSSRAVSAIVLAAGGSTRLGKAKQLIAWQSATLLGFIIATIKKAGIENIITVLGSQHAKIQESIDISGLRIVVNSDWQKGIGTSIKTGGLALPREETDIMIFVCDQPFLSVDLIQRIITTKQESGGLIIAPQVNEITCNPVLFDHSLRSELLSLPNGKGGKSLFGKYCSMMYHIEWPDERILLDIDTVDDLSNLSL